MVQDTRRINPNSGRGRGRNFFKPKIFCQVCGKPGHTAVQCYHRLDLSYNGPQNHLSYNGPQNQNQPQQPQYHQTIQQQSFPPNQTEFLEQANQVFYLQKDHGSTSQSKETLIPLPNTPQPQQNQQQISRIQVQCPTLLSPFQ